MKIKNIRDRAINIEGLWVKPGQEIYVEDCDDLNYHKARGYIKILENDSKNKKIKEGE
jgi:hypothetical protein